MFGIVLTRLPPFIQTEIQRPDSTKMEIFNPGALKIILFLDNSKTISVEKSVLIFQMILGEKC